MFRKNKKTKAQKKEDRKKQPLLFKLFYLFLYTFLSCGIIIFLGLVIYGFELNRQYDLDKADTSGVLWELPSRVYARPMELYVGKPLNKDDLQQELDFLNYQRDAAVSRAGSYHFDDSNHVLIYKNAFGFWDQKEPSQVIRITLEDGKITDLIDMDSISPISIVRLEPLLIGSIYPKHGQDRRLISVDNTPDVLIDTILATEDRRFYQHPGIDPKGIIRAIYQGIKTGKVKQGASTLTQQFVKNHYLTNERSISRKVKEAIIAVILEHKLTKEQILEGYLNEIFLGQDGKRAIHGFGMAAEHYFGKSLNQLGVHQVASLVALVNEPSNANPFKRPQIAKKRRDFILEIMVRQNLISRRDSDLAKELPLGVLTKENRKKSNRFHAFLDLVMREIKKEYDSDSLASGLNIFTTLDPVVQDKIEKKTNETLAKLEKKEKLKKGFLQTASVLVNTSTAEIVAIIGDRDTQRKGFNRAINAKRPPGSLLKPVVYMSALEYPKRYNLATLIQDSPLVYKVKGEVWKPRNSSRKYKGWVSMIDALVYSYNVPTARIALDIGISDIIGRLEDLGARKGLPHFPSIALGSVGMSPLEVTQIYESLANGGYRMPLRVINSVTDAEDTAVTRYPMESVKVISDEPYYLIVKAMQEVVKRGTARRMGATLPELNIAGKTGTTDDYRDSWFAGFTGNYLNVVWVGNDDNKRTGLTGSRGAMQVWVDTMSSLTLQPLVINKPENVFEFPIDLSTGNLVGESCAGKRKEANVPFIAGSEPTIYNYCEPKPVFQNNYNGQPQDTNNTFNNQTGSTQTNDDRIAEDARKALEAFGYSN